MIIPTLPKEARQAVALHQSAGKLAVYRIVSGWDGARCTNCMDDGLVYISLLGAGPTRQPVTMSKPSTYHAGDGFAGKGWYVIEKTICYPCPSCSSGKPVTSAGKER